jgi:hypothetical protein
MKYIYYSFIITVLITAAACTNTKYIKNLNKGQSAVHGSFGGPVVSVPGAGSIPLPLTSIGYGYGASTNATVFGTWYPTAALFGNAQLDLGASFKLKKNDSIYGFTIAPQLNVFTHKGKNWRMFPEINTNFYHTYKLKNTARKLKSNYYYLGINTYFDLSLTKANGVKQSNNVIVSPQVGHCFERSVTHNHKNELYARPKTWVYTVEAKFIAPYLSNQNIVLDYASPLGKRGALGVYFGIVRKF